VVGVLALLVGAPAANADAAAHLRSRALEASGTRLAPCDDPPGTLCGSIDVPLDRRRPGAGTIPIFFAIVAHSDPGPGAGTILATEGGPGVSSTASVDGFADLFAPLLDRRDLLTIDLRGTGRSAAIDCPGLQHAIGDRVSALRACGGQLGASASLYGSGDRADDIDDVRAALGIARLDYYGLSGGGLQVQAYAARYGRRLRTAVLDAPYRVGFDDAFQSPTAGALVGSAELVCERSPSCRAADRAPRRTLRALLERVRRHPVTGTALDADGQSHRVVVDEARVIDLLADTSGGSLDASEISAAGRALARGDAAPLLHMAAETDFPTFVDQGDTRLYSDGDFAATFCTDGIWPFEKAAPEATRRAQYDAAVAGLRPDAFAPFSVAGWLRSDVPVADGCVPWPAPTPAPAAIPTGASFPAAPALVLTGDLDTSVPSENVRAVAAQFPRGEFVSVANGGHVTAFDSPCVRSLIARFIETASRVDASCASRFNPTYGVGVFARRAQDARPAPVDPAAGDASRRLDRRVAAAAWAAAYDAIQRSFRMSGGSGVGLRGGSFTVGGAGPTVDLAYDGVRFAGDVSSSGSAHVDFDTGHVTADLAVDGPGGEDGTLRVAGRLFPHTSPLPASGVIGGRRVAVLVPSA
jgi:pimeloyl-ACP methyl ester carboxylesterase